MRQEKGLIDKESLIICIEDPEKPIGSGGATLNALLVVAESLSAQKGLKVTFLFLFICEFATKTTCVYQVYRFRTAQRWLYSHYAHGKHLPSF